MLGSLVFLWPPDILSCDVRRLLLGTVAGRPSNAADAWLKIAHAHLTMRGDLPLCAGQPSLCGNPCVTLYWRKSGEGLQAETCTKVPVTANESADRKQLRTGQGVLSAALCLHLSLT